MRKLLVTIFIFSHLIGYGQNLGERYVYKNTEWKDQIVHKENIEITYKPNEYFEVKLGTDILKYRILDHNRDENTLTNEWNVEKENKIYLIQSKVLFNKQGEPYQNFFIGGKWEGDFTLNQTTHYYK